MTNRLYLGSPEGRFRRIVEGEFAAHADTSAAIAGADYDLDGDIDLFVANWGGPGSVNRLYRNTAAGGWLRVELEGTRSNRMGIGARVSIRIPHGAGHRWVHRWLDTTTGYAGQNEPVLHFGLGDASGADSLVVAWPSGEVDRHGSVARGVVARIREGAAEPAVCAARGIPDTRR
jgi:hypothetical protein